MKRPKIVTPTALFMALTAILIQQVLGQVVQLIFILYVPPQTVEVIRNSELTQALVAARIRIFPDGKAEGRFHLRTREDGKLVFRATEGRGVLDEDGALERVELAFIDPDGELATATVTPNTSDPDSHIWDFVGSAVEEFEARGRIIVREVSR